MLTQKGVPFSWGVTEVTASQKLKDKMTTGPVLILPYLQKSFKVYCDTCGRSLGVVLMQEGRVIAYESRMLSKPEMTAQIYGKELLALNGGIIYSERILLCLQIIRVCDTSCHRSSFGTSDAVLEMINNSHYLYRMTILNAISLLAPVMGAEVTCQTMLPVVVNAAKDRVPNIKFNVAKVLQSLIPVVDPTVVDQTIRPCLVELSEDPDVDVRYFAAQALQSCDQNMST
ncbi:hypothetical protein L7F22_009090 [Adiantum nelumboides]|nr:hypothetical protein [Adiantum nelumboides]